LKNFAVLAARAKVKHIVEGSLEDLSMFEDNTFDSVLCLGGALCHLVSKKKREKAVGELIRVAKDDAPIFISVLGRFAVCINAIVYLWPEMLEAPDVFRKYSTTGDCLGGWGFAPAHFYSVEELKKESEHKTTTLQMVGLEGIFSAHQRLYKRARWQITFFDRQIGSFCLLPLDCFQECQSVQRGQISFLRLDRLFL